MATDTRHKHDVRHSETTRPPRQTASSSRDREWEHSSSSAFSIMRQGIDEMERLVGQFGRGWGAAGGWPSGRGLFSHLTGQGGDWSPAIDAFQRGNEFIIRAEVPGMKRDQLTVEIGDESVTIHGERKREFAEDREGVVWSERNYGSFTRIVPLPAGAIGDSAKASFTDGILEIVMQVPSPEARRGRRIDISGGGGGERG